MQVTLDGRARKGRQIGFVLKNCVVCNHGNFIAVQIQPIWNLSIRNQINVVNPWGVFFKRSEKIYV